MGKLAPGRARPRAIAWFGFTSFWGHLRHLVASAIATENIDSRQWMIPDAPEKLLGRALDVLAPRGAKAKADTLVEGLGGEAWIDFVADTGDDVSVSEAVARLVAGTYEVEIDGEVKSLPRGDVLLLGGDLAYPVATVREITRRLLDPWNRVLAEDEDGRPRVLLGIPGNHDWYDGLDGFARLVQAPCAFEGTPHRAEALHPAPDPNPVLAWAEAFSRGEAVRKPGALALFGYEPVQRASYFRLPLAPGLELFAVDRQLRQVDPRQRAYFRVRGGAPARLLVMPDPIRAWGEVRPNGAQALAALGIEPAKEPTLVLTGDIHHYERSAEGPSLHVVSGGGGAFLHGSRLAKGGVYARDVEFPGPIASGSLLRRLPWHVAMGKAGWVVTCVFGVAHALALEAFERGGMHASLEAGAIISVIVALSTALLVGWRRHRALLVVPFALATGVCIGALPVLLGVLAEEHAASHFGALPLVCDLVVAWALATWTSGLAFGAMLAIIARFALNHAQPFAALGGSAFKEFVRLKVTRDGTLEAFVVGVVDPLAAEGDPRGAPVLVDHFVWPERPAR